MKRVIVGGVFLLVAALILAAFPRYEIAGAGGNSAARLDRWTGDVEFFVLARGGVIRHFDQKPLRTPAK